MKIFKDDRVYVQMDDLEKIKDSLLPMPISIFEFLFLNSFSISDDNRYEFIAFDKEEEIEFFKGIEWIINYSEYMKYSLDVHSLKLQGAINQINRIAEVYNELVKQEINDKKDLYNLLYEYKLKEHEIKYIKEILDIKNGESEIVLHNFRIDNDKRNKLVRQKNI